MPSRRVVAVSALLVVSALAATAQLSAGYGGSPLAGAEIPKEESAPPSAAEWEQAKTVKPSRSTSGNCELSLLREWLKVDCPGYAAAGLVAGSPKGVSIKATNSPELDKSSVSVVLPLRRGEARIVSFLALNFEFYGSATLQQGLVLSSVWRSGRPDPLLVMR